MKDSNFIIGLKFYLIAIHYSIFVGYIYASYKNYNVSESVLISAIIGILSPFFIPFHYIVYYFYKKERYIVPYNTDIETVPAINFKILKHKYNNNRLIKTRV